jgi:hypothetical protein
MDANLLERLLGRDQHWQGPCTVVLDAEAVIQTHGSDAIGAAGAKTYAPRLASGRIPADAVCYLPESSALVLVQQQRNRQQTGEEAVRTTLTIADASHVVAIEFCDLSALVTLGLTAPPTRNQPSGTYSHPKVPPRPTS